MTAPAAEPLPVSVVIPAYEREGMVERAIRSAQAQRPRPPLEVLVVDDGSTDATAAVAEAAGARVIRQSANAGAATARNAGIAAAHGAWIAFLDSDDEWLPGHLAAVWPPRDGAALVATSMRIVDPDGATLGMGGAPGGAAIELRSPTAVVWPENVVPASAMLAPTALLRELGGFRTDLRMAEDLDLVLRLLERGPGRVVPEVGLVYHHHGGGKSRRREDAFAAQEAIVAAFAGRPWWSPRAARRRAGVRRWDRARTALREGDRSAAARGLAVLLRRPDELVGVVGALRWRRRKRQAAARLPD